MVYSPTGSTIGKFITGRGLITSSFSTRVIALVQPGGKKTPFSVRLDWALMLPYAPTTLPEE
jgi:hypothetical protein